MFNYDRKKKIFQWHRPFSSYTERKTARKMDDRDVVEG